MAPTINSLPYQSDFSFFINLQKLIFYVERKNNEQVVENKFSGAGVMSVLLINTLTSSTEPSTQMTVNKLKNEIKDIKSLWES